jgi:hypothetical protein
MAGKPRDPNAPKIKRNVKPRKNFLMYKLSQDDTGNPTIKAEDVSFTRDAMDLVLAIQRGDGTKFVEVQLKK